MIKEWAESEDQEKVAHDECQRKQYDNDSRGDARRDDYLRNDNSRGNDRRWNNFDQSHKHELEDTVASMEASKLSKAFKSLLYKRCPFYPTAVIPRGNVTGSKKHSKMVLKFRTSLMNQKTQRERRRRRIVT